MGLFGWRRPEPFLSLLLWVTSFSWGGGKVSMEPGRNAKPGGHKSKMISTLLDSKWPETPFLLEAAEYLAEENAEYFWSLMDYLSEETTSFSGISDKELYDNVVSFASRYLSLCQLNLLKFSLSLRIYSPKIQMFQQVAKDRGVADLECDAVVEHRGRLSCFTSVSALSFDLDSDRDSSPTTLSQLDHYHPLRDDNAETVILYAQPGTVSFQKAHRDMVEMAGRGQVHYILRPFILRPADRPTRLSGYGIELQIKSTEYKAQDDRQVETGDDSREEGCEDGYEANCGSAETDLEGFYFNRLMELHPEEKERLTEFKQHLLDRNNDMAPMKVWELQDLSYQAATRIMTASEDEEERLKTWIDIAQNFPSYARSMSRIKASKDLLKEVKKNKEIFSRDLGIGPEDSALYINGLHFDMDYTDIFTLLETVKSEAKVLDGLGKLGLSNEVASAMISLDFSGSEKQAYGVDIRDTAVNWINDLEEDAMYRGWMRSVEEMLRPTFPGMLRSIRKNLFNIVALCNPSQYNCRSVIKILHSFYSHRAPVRIGLVFTVNSDPKVSGNDDAGVAIANAFNYVTGHRDPSDALDFIIDVYKNTDGMEIDLKTIHKTFFEGYGADVKLDDVFGPDSEYDFGRRLAKDFLDKTGFTEVPKVLVNGVPLETPASESSDDLEEAVMMSLMKETNAIQRAVYHNLLKDGDNCLEYLMKQPHIMPRLNERILGSGKQEEEGFVDLISGRSLSELKANNFAALDTASMAATLVDHMKYLSARDGYSNKLQMFTAWIVTDLESQEGRRLLRNAVQYLKSGASPHVRVGLIHITDKPGVISRIVQATLETQSNTAAKSIISKVLKEDIVKAIESGKKSVYDYDVPGADMHAFRKRCEELEEKRNDDIFNCHRMFVDSMLGGKFRIGGRGIILNGKVIGPLAPGEIFSEDDFGLLEKVSMTKFGDKMIAAIHTNMRVNDDNSELSNKAMKISQLLLSRSLAGGKSRHKIRHSSAKHSVINISPALPNSLSLDIVAIVDPVSRGSQKIAPLLTVLRRVINAKITIYFNCVDKHSEMPQKSYFRLVLEPELQFSDLKDGGKLLSSLPQARFIGLPEEPILTLHYHIPDNWLIGPTRSLYDLDNIKLENVEGNVHSEFELEHLLLEGHCFESPSGNPPRGLQLTLGTKQNPLLVDTIVMANLGYLQLKANPGSWLLNLREGRSSDIYEIVSHENTKGGSTVGDDGGKDIKVLISSFKSAIVQLKVAKKPGKKDEELLESNDGEYGATDDGSLWSSITSTFTGSSTTVKNKSEDKEGAEDVLDIFCLASGHLYERLLKIMMLSTMRHTNAKRVKFWILKNFLSPSLKEFLPEYAARYGFDYEFVQYKWPRWLNQQKEKQRIIWGYKILFLDVMFPLHVRKIIFVDTDQIVRADLKELRDMDLSGCPYAYTPFCDSNKDMEGFRFWKQGYWRNHLAGRKYHISALYVVDLVKFRQVAAGDRLRGQYQALSNDPNSLANLDQDLPNNMIHQVPIKSLPQDWLWCETWCDQASKATAKSIDLCNNPLTKESKLDAARRIAPEWTAYDDEMNQLAEEIKSASSTANSRVNGRGGGGGGGGGDAVVNVAPTDDIRQTDSDKQTRTEL